MAENENSIQLASLEKMKKGERKKTLKRLYKEVRKDKRFKKAVKSSSEEPISKKAAGAAAAAATSIKSQSNFHIIKEKNNGNLL